MIFSLEKKNFIAALLIFAVGILVGYLLVGIKLGQSSKRDPLAAQIHNKHIFCTSKECLYYNNETGATEGFAVLKGYYDKYKSSAWGNEVYCDSLKITGGSQKLIDNFNEIIEMGNTINRFDESKGLLVNIDLTKLDPSSKQMILSSSPYKPVELGVLRTTPEGRDAPICHSFVDILYVRQSN